MSTAAQIQANRLNATHSTGPRSEAGKSTVSRNALSHGLSTNKVVLTSEDAAAFDKLQDSLLCEFDADTENEFFLIRQMAESRWRLARIRRIETAVFDAMLGEESNTPEARLAQVFLKGSGDPLSKLQRYAADAERSYYKAHKELLASIAARGAQAETRIKLQDRHMLDSILGTSFCETNPILEHDRDRNNVPGRSAEPAAGVGAATRNG